MAPTPGNHPGQSRLLRQLSVPMEVHLRRMKVRDALVKLERYLNDATVGGLPWVRIVHGKGTGTMRRAVLDYISRHPLVTGHEFVSPSEGDGGVTIARLSGGPPKAR